MREAPDRGPLTCNFFAWSGFPVPPAAAPQLLPPLSQARLEEGAIRGMEWILKNKEQGPHGKLSYRSPPELGGCWSRARPQGSPRAVGNDGASTRVLVVALCVG